MLIYSILERLAKEDSKHFGKSIKDIIYKTQTLVKKKLTTHYTNFHKFYKKRKSVLICAICG